MKKKTQKLVTLIVIIIALFSARFMEWEDTQIPDIEIQDGVLSVHFVDVGQADGTFISLPNGETMVIDAGTNAAAEDFVSYIRRTGTKKIDYVVGTHPHEDHIGGLDNVIDEFEIGEIYMPYASTDTESFEDVLEAIKRKGENIHTAKSGVEILNTDGIKIEFVAPVSEFYEELNNYSAVVKLTYKDTSFLFMADAEKESEKEIYSDIKADVLKVGHHGSSSSTTNSFLKRVKPDIAVISVGEDNEYYHPADSVLNRLERFGCEIYRTDYNGNIVVVSDGEKISCTSEK